MDNKVARVFRAIAEILMEKSPDPITPAPDPAPVSPHQRGKFPAYRLPVANPPQRTSE
jgi:hypothetical protein